MEEKNKQIHIHIHNLIGEVKVNSSEDCEKLVKMLTQSIEVYLKSYSLGSIDTRAMIEH